MMRRALHECLRSAKNKASKSKPFWLPKPSHLTTNTTPNINTSLFNTKHRESTKTTLGPLTRPFCTANATTAPYSLGTVVTVTRSEPELVGPAEPTPLGVKKLSFLDDRLYLRCLAPMIQVYRCDPSMRGKDPARVIRDALARALVLYYPFAGRLREGADGRLSVDCTGEGVVFVEADADVELHELGDPPQPYLPWFDEFLYNAPSIFEGIVNSPLLYIQVTRLKCGSFVVALRINHIMCDGAGLTQFLNAVGEIARGDHPQITPVWKRQLFSAPHSTSTTHDHKQDWFSIPKLVQHSIFLGPSKLSAIRRLTLERATMFETLTAYLWRCQTHVLDLHPEDKMHLGFTVNARDKSNKVVPEGYYGNAVAIPVIATNAKKLRERPIEYAIGLVKKGKEEGIKQYMSWQTDTPIIFTSFPSDFSFDKSLNVTDVRGVGYGDVDFGWGKAVFAGVVKSEAEGIASYSSYRNHNGEDGILVTMCLQPQVMESFETEVNNI